MDTVLKDVIENEKRKEIVDQMKDKVTFLGTATLSFMELFVQAKDHNINGASSSKGVSESKEDLSFGSNEFIKEFDKTITKAKKFKRQTIMPDFDLGIDDEELEEKQGRREIRVAAP
ncbi:hypothetical protein M9H77_21703 [Catharanthus roseus]|uniref:Uncharacterized protein n=1 Tax=Catharanthus roseus TaxID=4058 RepID=A0ACC0ANB8_CATRO|nr:hypothetical protein M9H77_21703 [Catharanthus roseus]